MDKSNKIVFSSFVKAFTLIEIIIVVAIMILFAGLSIGYYNDFTQQKKLISATTKIVDVLELVKKKTLSGDSSQCTFTPQSSARVEDYSFIVNSSSTYKLSPKCTIGNPNEVSYITDSNIVFPTPTVAFEFKPFTASTATNCFLIKNLVSNKCQYIRVENSGTVCNGSCSSCNACVCSSCQ
jgi:Tfp pilus assembly major pilin PilA